MDRQTYWDSIFQATQGLIHFAIPALHWWDDVVFT